MFFSIRMRTTLLTSKSWSKFCHSLEMRKTVKIRLKMIFLSCLITWFYNKLDFDVVFEAYLNR